MNEKNVPEPQAKKIRNKAIPLPSQDKLRSLFFYTPETGELKWRIRIPNKIGLYQPVGHKDVTGYLATRIKGKMFRVHRLIWMLHYGEDPGLLHIDHVNGIKDDNRIQNLRLATQSQNACNCKMRSHNTSGVRGVSWMPQRKQWQTYINHKGKRFALGVFKNLDDAVKTVNEARERLHGEFQPSTP